MRKFFIHLGFLFIIAGLSIICVEKVSANINEYYADINRSKEIFNAVESDYNEFVSNASLVKNNMVNVSNALDVYLEEFPEKESLIVEKIKVVDENINSLKEISLRIVENCKYELNNKAMENKCSNFILNYNRMIESYKVMVREYNKVIDSYNDYKNEDVYKYYTGGVDYSVYDLIKK